MLLLVKSSKRQVRSFRKASTHVHRSHLASFPMSKFVAEYVQLDLAVVSGEIVSPRATDLSALSHDGTTARVSAQKTKRSAAPLRGDRQHVVEVCVRYDTSFPHFTFSFAPHLTYHPVQSASLSNGGQSTPRNELTRTPRRASQQHLQRGGRILQGHH